MAVPTVGTNTFHVGRKRSTGSVFVCSCVRYHVRYHIRYWCQIEIFLDQRFSVLLWIIEEYQESEE